MTVSHTGATLIAVCLLSGCAGRNDGEETSSRRSRGLSLWQVGLVNVIGDSTLEARDTPETTRLRIDQRLRFDNNRN